MTVTVDEFEDDVMEAPAKQEQPPIIERPPYVPPNVRQGDEISYYANGEVRDDAPIGLVLEVSGVAISLVLYDKFNPQGAYFEDVLHVEHPWLQERPDRKAAGSWDFSPREKKLRALDARLSRYEDRLVELEAFVTSLDPNFKPSNGEAAKATPRKKK